MSEFGMFNPIYELEKAMEQLKKDHDYLTDFISNAPVKFEPTFFSNLLVLEDTYKEVSFKCSAVLGFLSFENLSFQMAMDGSKEILVSDGNIQMSLKIYKVTSQKIFLKVFLLIPEFGFSNGHIVFQKDTMELKFSDTFSTDYGISPIIEKNVQHIFSYLEILSFSNVDEEEKNDKNQILPSIHTTRNISEDLKLSTVYNLFFEKHTIYEEMKKHYEENFFEKLSFSPSAFVAQTGANYYAYDLSQFKISNILFREEKKNIQSYEKELSRSLPENYESLIFLKQKYIKNFFFFEENPKKSYFALDSSIFGDDTVFQNYLLSIFSDGSVCSDFEKLNMFLFTMLITQDLYFKKEIELPSIESVKEVLPSYLTVDTNKEALSYLLSHSSSKTLFEYIPNVLNHIKDIFFSGKDENDDFVEIEY